MTIPIMEMIKELHRLGFWFGSTKPTIHCQVFQDNSSVIEIATVPKICPQTKHINVKYHHFWDYVDQGKILSMPLTAKINQLTCSPSLIHMRHSANITTRPWVGAENQTLGGSVKKQGQHAQAGPMPS